MKRYFFVGIPFSLAPIPPPVRFFGNLELTAPPDFFFTGPPQRFFVLQAIVIYVK